METNPADWRGFCVSLQKEAVLCRQSFYFLESASWSFGTARSTSLTRAQSLIITWPTCTIMWWRLCVDLCTAPDTRGYFLWFNQCSRRLNHADTKVVMPVDLAVSRATVALDEVLRLFNPCAVWQMHTLVSKYKINVGAFT